MRKISMGLTESGELTRFRRTVSRSFSASRTPPGSCSPRASADACGYRTPRCSRTTRRALVVWFDSGGARSLRSSDWRRSFQPRRCHSSCPHRSCSTQSLRLAGAVGRAHYCSGRLGRRGGLTELGGADGVRFAYLHSGLPQPPCATPVELEGTWSRESMGYIIDFDQSRTNARGLLEKQPDAGQVQEAAAGTQHSKQ